MSTMWHRSSKSGDVFYYTLSCAPKHEIFHNSRAPHSSPSCFIERSVEPDSERDFHQRPECLSVELRRLFFWFEKEPWRWSRIQQAKWRLRWVTFDIHFRFLNSYEVKSTRVAERVSVYVYVRSVINHPEQTERKSELRNVISATYGSTYYQSPWDRGKLEELSDTAVVD